MQIIVEAGSGRESPGESSRFIVRWVDKPWVASIWKEFQLRWSGIGLGRGVGANNNVTEAEAVTILEEDRPGKRTL